MTKDKSLTNNKYKVDIKTLIINIVLTTLILYLIIGTAFTGKLSSLSLTDIVFEVIIDLFIELVVLKDTLYLHLLLLSLIIAVIINILNEAKNTIKYNRNHMIKRTEKYRMVNLDKDKYYKGYFDTDDNNPTVKILYTFDTERTFNSYKELSDNIREQAKINVHKWIEFNNSSNELLKNQLVYLLNNTFKQFMPNKKLGRYRGEIKQYINTDKALTMLDITFHTKIFDIGVDNFVDSVLELGVDSIRKLLETISMLHIIDKID